MNQDKLYRFEVEDWKALEGQFTSLYKPTFSFVLENKGTMAEARDVYVEAFLYYLQLLELRGIKLSQKAEDLIYSFSRKLWILKLEKRRVDLDFVRHRREYFEMEEAFHEIDSINQRSAKTAEKLAEIGEPCRTLMLECVGRKKDLAQVSARLGFSDDNRAFAQLCQCFRKLIKFTEGKEFTLPESRFEELVRYALDGIHNPTIEVSDEEKICITMVSRAVAMVRNHVTRGQRADRFREMQEKSMPHSLSMVDDTSVYDGNNNKFMKSIAIVGIAVLAAAGVSALTAFTVSESMHKRNEITAADTLEVDTVEVLSAPVVEAPPQGISAFAVANGGYLLTAAHPLAKASRLTASSKHWETDLSVEIVFRDTANNLALLRIAEMPAISARLPYRLSPQGLSLGEQVFSLGFPEGDMHYTDGSLTAFNQSGNAQLRMPLASTGAPLIEARGQVAGMVVSDADGTSGMCRVIASEKISAWLADANRELGLAMQLPQRNGLFYSEKPRQIEQLQPFIVALHIYH